MKNFIFSFCVYLFVLANVSPVYAEGYLIQSGDILHVLVYDNDDLEVTVRVDDDGYLVMPLIGQVRVSGMSVSSAGNLIEKMLADGYIVDPLVNVALTSSRGKKIYALGRVNRPGVVELSGRITFLELISSVGGLKEDAADTATIKRLNSNGEHDVIIVDLDSLIEGGDLTQNVLIQEDDTVFIPKAGMCYITGEVSRPNAYLCGDNITVLKLVTMAGGFTGIAAESRVKLVRMENGEKTILKGIDLHTQKVQPDDIIIVPQSFF